MGRYVELVFDVEDSYQIQMKAPGPSWISHSPRYKNILYQEKKKRKTQSTIELPKLPSASLRRVGLGMYASTRTTESWRSHAFAERSELGGRVVTALPGANSRARNATAEHNVIIQTARPQRSPLCSWPCEQVLL
jgi:hypothetical protein